jgi:hypothetical protein
MSAPSPLQALRAPGRLVINPTTSPPTDAFPHGGTAMGLVRDVKVRRKERRFAILAEEWGSSVAEELWQGGDYLLAFALRGLDDDALNVLFPGETSLGSPSGVRGIGTPVSGRREGSQLSASAVKLLFSPLDPTRHRAVYLRSAIPLLAEDLEVPLQRRDEALVAVAFRALRDGTTPASSIQVRLLEDLTL